MDAHLTQLRESSNRLHALVAPLDDAALERPAYPSEWSIADVLSHIGSGAVIMRRRLQDAIAREATPDDFAPEVWDAWNTKSPRGKADDALVADRQLVDDLEALTDEDKDGLEFALGPLTLSPTEFVALRLNEHALHTWDVEVALEPDAIVPVEAAALVVDNLGLIARFTGKPTGADRAIIVATTDPARTFRITLTPDAVDFAPSDTGAAPDLELPAEAFARLIYGRLDPDHTPAFTGTEELMDVLRQTYPGP